MITIGDDSDDGILTSEGSPGWIESLLKKVQILDAVKYMKLGSYMSSIIGESLLVAIQRGNSRVISEKYRT